MKNIYFFAFYFLFIFCYAQEQQDNYSIKWLNADTGLKQLSVKQCITDGNGFVWIATELGLFRYDGNSIIEINEKKYPSLNKQRINRIGKDIVTGKIYLETNPDGYQYVVYNDTIKRLDPTKFWKNTIFTFNEICYTNSQPIVKEIFNNPEIESYLREYSSINFLTACCTKNHFYLPLKSKLIQFDNNGKVDNSFNLSCSTGVFLMQYGDNIIVADREKATLLVDGKVTTKKLDFDLIFKIYLNRSLINMSNFEIFGSKDNYFLKINGKIYKVIYNKFKISTKFLFNSPADDISSITYLEKENIYLAGTRTQGIAVLKPILFNTISFDVNKSNKSINYCYSTIKISENRWYSSSGWNYYFNNSKSKLDDFLIDFRNTRFILPYKNKFYIHSKNDFWNIENKKNDYGFFFPKKIKNKFIGFSGYTYHDGVLFLTDPTNIYKIKQDTLVVENNFYDNFPKSPLNGIFSINNSLILATIRGVYIYSPNSKKVSLIKGFENVNARYLKQIDKNSYWVGCYGNGLFLVYKNKIFKVQDKNIDITTTHAIEEDNNGNLWISTNDGLLKINKKEAISKIYKNIPIECYRFSTENGLLTNEFNGGGTHTSLQTKDGVIGFASMKGFVWFYPNKVAKHLFKGNIIMDKVVVYNKNIIPVNNIYTFSKEVDLVSLYFSFAYHFNRENLTVAYRFEDQNKWTEVRENYFQIPRYKKGNHKLIIRISTHGFSDNAAVFKTINLNFESKFFETYWFWILLSILLLIVLYASYRTGIYLSKQREIQLKERIKGKTAQLQASVLDLENTQISLTNSLNQKNILLKEIHHRVKNNLQLVMSILNIQASDNENTSIEGFIEKGQSRIASMVLIHENLYQKEDIGNINFDTYMESLVKNIRITFGDSSDRISVNLVCKQLFFDIQTSIPLGLIINELVTNSFKHAFPNDRKGLITISIQIDNETDYKLIIQDNGIGIKEEKLEKKSIGLELVSLLVLQLNGQLTVNSEKGTSYEINFSL